MTLPRHPLLLAALLALALTACERAKPAAQQEVARRRVLTTVYPLSDVVRQVGGEWVDTDWLCENGNDPRDLKLSDEQKRLLKNADLIVSSGFADVWIGQTLDLHQQALRLIRPEATPAGRALANGSDDDEDAPRPDLWLDPLIVKDLADSVREHLTVLEASHDRAFRANAEAFVRAIDALDAEFRPRLAPLAGKRFLALRPTWGRLAERYGLQEVAPVNTEPRKLTDAEVRALRDAAHSQNTDVLAVESSLLPGVQRELQLRTGLRLLLLDSLGSSAPDARSTWLRLFRYNLEQLEKGLK
jgi:ABC-type Zn uptake system ZnuABC Zn-binding protein ZnuA